VKINARLFIITKIFSGEKKKETKKICENSLLEYLMFVFITFCYTVHLRWTIPVIIERMKSEI